MCWNKEVSFLTLIIGTIFTVLLYVSYSDKDVRAIALMWQFVLFMQLFEGLSWISKEKNDKELSEFSTRCAFVFNMLQPVVAGLVCMSVRDTKLKYHISILILIYIGIVLYSSSSNDLTKSLYDDNSCNHLQLYWWKHFSISVFILYIIIIVLSYGSLKRIGIIQLSYIFVTLFLSAWIYPCTYGSMWCWFVALAPLLTYLLLKLYPNII
jgi:hypothetical protein